MYFQIFIPKNAFDYKVGDENLFDLFSQCQKTYTRSDEKSYLLVIYFSRHVSCRQNLQKNVKTRKNKEKRSRKIAPDSMWKKRRNLSSGVISNSSLAGYFYISAVIRKIHPVSGEQDSALKQKKHDSAAKEDNAKRFAVC